MVAVTTVGASSIRDNLRAFRIHVSKRNERMSYFHETPSDPTSRSSERRERELAQARRLFETFAGFSPPILVRRRIDRIVPEVLVDLGALRGVIYTKDHRGTRTTYIHFMDDPPRLMCDADGRQIYVLGGSYRITRRGIEG